jgi:outer membrane lipoprotein-sorting protein
MKHILMLLLFFSLVVNAQSKDPDEIINKVITNFSKVQDYQVDVNVKVDVDFLKVPETKAVIYFKQPDKIHLEAEGFALLPKDGLDFSPSFLAKKDYTAIYEQDVDLEGFKTSIIKIIPVGDQGNIILSTLWIDQSKQMIRKVESTTKTNGTFTINFSYENKSGYPLPSKIIFSFNIDERNLPKSLTEDPDQEKPKKRKSKMSGLTKGKVTISYNNYKVNKGLSDSIFQEQIKTKQ